MADVTLPSLGESVTEGIVTRWFKAIGEHVERDEPLLEISTDKVDSELPSPAAGVLSEILAGEGDTVEVGAVLGRIVAGDAAAVSSASGEPAPAAPAPSSEPAPVAPSQTSAAPSAATGAGSGSITSPVVRRILSDANIDPSRVTGTGANGTITRRDAERAVAGGAFEEVVVPIAGARRRMAEHMAASVQTSPHAFVAVEVRADALARLHELGDTTADGVTIEPPALVAVAVVRALGEFELLNATMSDEGLVVHPSVNLGVMLGLDDGMLVPVIHAASGLTLRAMAKRIVDLEQRTQARQLSTDDLLGATFTIGAAPSQHALFSVPILIQPQVAVVSVGAARRVPVAIGPVGEEIIGIEERITIGCSFDHRVVDATYVGRFLDRVAALLGGLDVDSER